MITFLVNYATEAYLEAQKNSCLCAIGARFDRIIPCGPANLTEQFKKDNALIMSQELGAGNCIWKPRIILDVMLSEMKDGDFILYMDASDVFREDIKSYALDHLNDHGQFFIQTVFKHRNFTRKRCFEIMGCDSPEYWESFQVEAGCVGLLKNSFNISFLEEWLHYCCIPDAMIRIPEKDPNTLEGFQRHSCDQSILSLLVTKYRLGVSNNSVAEGRINYNIYG